MERTDPTGCAGDLKVPHKKHLPGKREAPAPSGAPMGPANQQQLLEVALGQRSPSEVSGYSLRGLDAMVAYRRSQHGDQLTALDRRALAVGATTCTLLEETLEEIGRHLQAARIPFVLLKGAASARLYPRPELRPTSDLDLLISYKDLAQARQKLEASGWRSVVTGRYAEDYLQEEGSCWQGYRPGRVVLELHFRFWGSVASTFQDSVLSAATESHGQLIPSPTHRLIIAAAHAWRQPTPRRATDLLDVCLLLQSSGQDAFTNLHQEANLAGQLLPVCLALDLAASTLEKPWINCLLTQFEAALRLPERRVISSARLKGSDRVPWTHVRLGMLCARRPSRAGWRSIIRQAWPHRGVLEQRTAGHRPWPANRLTELSRTIQALFVRR